VENVRNALPQELGSDSHGQEEESCTPAPEQLHTQKRNRWKGGSSQLEKRWPETKRQTLTCQEKDDKIDSPALGAGSWDPCSSKA
jgi:hypothetical protein